MQLIWLLMKQLEITFISTILENLQATSLKHIQTERDLMFGILIIPSHCTEVSSKQPLFSLKPQLCSSIGSNFSYFNEDFKSCYCYYDMVSWSALLLAQTNFDTTKMWIFSSQQNFLYSTLYSKQLPTIASTSLMESICWCFHNHMSFVCPDSTSGQRTEHNTSATTVPQATASRCFSPLSMYTKAHYP